ncbi:MAG TPA: (2Fe-2S)-binding protein [Hyphomicrobiaceae bacterium]|nr:(2Fe-2S)-binding protein [Hyphomicrobiaceae bacterium]
MKVLVSCRVNGEQHSVLVDPRDTLLELLRERIGLTGTKEGCGNGNCGTCTVLFDGMPVNACLVLALEAPGHEVLTIEGVARGPELDPIQRALVEVGGTQCGFCTPGIVLSAKALLAANPAPSELDIRQAIAGNLCRCTGYNKVVDAIAAAAQATRKRLDHGA